MWHEIKIKSTLEHSQLFLLPSLASENQLSHNIWNDFARPTEKKKIKKIISLRGNPVSTYGIRAQLRWSTMTLCSASQQVNFNKTWDLIGWTKIKIDYRAPGSLENWTQWVTNYFVNNHCRETECRSSMVHQISEALNTWTPGGMCRRPSPLKI